MHPEMVELLVELAELNPLYAKWQEVNGGVGAPHAYWDRPFPSGDDLFTCLGEGRQMCCQTFSWAVPSPEALTAIAQYSRPGIAEVGAGLGYWAAMLARRGVDIICCDHVDPWENSYFSSPDPHNVPENFYTVVVEDAASFAQAQAHRTLLVVWPSYNQPWAADAVLAYWLAGGHTVIFVGEGPGGCTGDDALFELFDTRFVEVDECPVPQWWGINDWLTVYSRRELPELGRPKSDHLD